jgi:hypothetical protein
MSASPFSPSIFAFRRSFMNPVDYLIGAAIILVLVGLILCEEWLKRRKLADQRWHNELTEKQRRIQAGDNAAPQS